MNDKTSVKTPEIASKNLQLTKNEVKHLSQAIMTHVKVLEREARKHNNNGRSAVADLILQDASVILNIHQMLNN